MSREHIISQFMRYIVSLALLSYDYYLNVIIVFAVVGIIIICVW